MAKHSKVDTPSPSRRISARQQSARKGARQSRSPIFLDDEATDDDDDDDDDHRHPGAAHLGAVGNHVDDDFLYNARPLRSDRAVGRRTASTSTARGGIPSSTTKDNVAGPSTPSSRKPAERKKKEERKASVRKASYELDNPDSELSDVPDESDRGGSATGAGTTEHDLNETDSDNDMAARILAAGDGESLLGSAASSTGETDVEEERFIIEDTKRRQAKKEAQRTPSQHPSSPVRPSADDDIGARSDRSGSLSPHTLRQLGLDGLFDDGDAFGSSSEPSFTDFFGSDSDDDLQNDLQIHLDPRSDDDELTTDNDDDENDEDDDEDGSSIDSNISDLDEGMLSAPFMADALAVGAGTQLAPGTEAAAHLDVPLLVIEDLDGRLIYARAQDGEAVFGSDGEFEFVDDSDADDSDDDTDTGIWQPGQPWPGWRSQAVDDDETDSGDTTDELPNEDMPFPRLLVGSVAPHGGRNARRARAMAARRRRLSPTTAMPDRSREASASSAQRAGSETVNVSGKGMDNGGTIKDVDFTISTEALARDPKNTLETAARNLGITPDEVARMVAGIGQSGHHLLTPPMQQRAPLPTTPEGTQRTWANKPQMGSFMPTSSKSVHRAVIDGSRQAPSPFTQRHGTQKRGLAARKRQSMLGTPSSKRLRRTSQSDGTLNVPTNSAAEIASESGASASTRAQSPSPAVDDDDGFHHDDIVMDLDDVMDASMMWRGNMSSSPPREDGVGQDSATKTRPALRGRRSSTAAKKSPKLAGLNFDAVARWHRIPMAAFREGQLSSSSSTHPLGTYLLSRQRGGHAGKLGAQRNGGAGSSSAIEQSPFRSRGQSDEIHLGPIPAAANRDSFMVSPVLWPVRDRDMHASGSSSGAGALRHDTGLLYGTQAAAASSRKADGDTARKTMTRRQKRERKARKDAIKAAIRESGAAEDSAVSSPSGTGKTRVHGLDSPSAGMPRLSITDPSPRASPSPTVQGQQNKRSIHGLAKSSGSVAPSISQPSASKPIDIPSASHPSAPAATPVSTIHASSPAFAGMSSLPSAPSTAAYHQHVSGGTAGFAGSMSTSPASVASSSQQQPPSSVFGMPLHSPLFSGLLNPPNLGFRDDLDEREEDGVLTI